MGMTRLRHILLLVALLAGGMIGHAIGKSITLNHIRAKVAVMPTPNGIAARIHF